MYISVKINHNYPNALQHQQDLWDIINKNISSLSAKEIDAELNKKTQEIRKWGKWKDINVLYNDDDSPIYIKAKSLEMFIGSGAKELVNKIKIIHIENCVLLRLVNEGVLMPVKLRESPSSFYFQIANVYVKIIMDVFPFSKYIIIK